MNHFLHWYRHLSLRRRFVHTFNTVLFLTLSIIAIPALLNRVNNQFRDADNLLFPNLEELCLVLNIAGKDNWDDYKQVFYQKKLYNTGYASMISADGTLLIDPRREGANVSHEEYFAKMRQMKRGRVAFTDRTAADDRHKKFKFFVFNENLNSYLTFTIDHKELIANPLKNTSLILIFAFIFSSTIFTIAIIRISRSISKPLIHLQQDFDQIGRGVLPEIAIRHRYHDELGKMINSIKSMLEGLREKTLFAHEIGRNNFDHVFTPLSQDDVLGNALIDMRDSLRKAAQEEEIRKKEDDKRNWSTLGLARFSEILRQNNNDMKELSFEIIKNIVKYLNANQGGIFILNDENQEDRYLELTACYAYDRRKYLEQRINIGEGLVGTCMLEQKTTLITNLPRNYMKITSGLGDESPGCLLIVPLQLNEVSLGVIEIASFQVVEPYQVEFMEKLGESIASAITSTKTAQQTTMLLAQSQVQAEEMRAQEEEMRQNMEELTATQEEANRKNDQMEALIMDYQHKEQEYQRQLQKMQQEMSQKETQLRRTAVEMGIPVKVLDELLQSDRN